MEPLKIESYVNYFQNEFAKYLKEDLEFETHNEFSYDPDSDVNVTIKLLPAQIQCGVIQQPLEIIVEGDAELKEELIYGLTNFANDYNEKILTLDSAYFKQFYSTPNVIGIFQNKGIKDQFAMSMSATIISFNLLGCKQLLVEFETDDGEEETEAINAINYSAAYLGEPNATGSVGDPISRSAIETCALTQTFTYVPKDNSTLAKTFLNHIFLKNEINKTFWLNIEAMGGFWYRIKCVINTATFSQVSNGVPMFQISFLTKDEW